MKREIKFRVWDGERYLDQDIAISSKGRVIDIEECMWNYESENSVVQQYTGLKDRNGVEIYEGDILEELIMNETETQIGVCKQVLGGWRIFAHPNSSIRWHGWKQRVIGNIHENRDLLK
jgi:uncharacterized phage protein (TIGR01671 family)